MDTDRLEEACKQLRLSHIPRGFETKEDWLLFLLENELTCRDELKKVRLFKQAKFQVQRTLENYDWDDHITLPNPTIKEELISLSFIRQKENAVFVGTPGTGKTHLVYALGQMVTHAGIETRFWRVSGFVGELERQWNKVFIDTRLTAALVDRLIHHARILSFTGESFRLKKALSRPK